MKKTGRIYKPIEEWLPIAVPSIVNEDLFYRTQEQLKNNSFFSKRNQKFPYLLSGLLFCGCGCGARMSGDGQKKYRYYRSTDRVRRFPEKRICTALTIPVDKIETLVWSKIVDALNNPDIILKQLQDLHANKIGEQEEMKNQLLELGRRLDRIAAEEDKVVTAYRKDILSLDQLDIQIKDINRQKKQIENEKKELLNQPSQINIRVTPEKIEQYCAIARKNIADLTFAERQELLRLLVSKVIVKSKQVIIQGEIPIDAFELKDDSQSSVISSGRFGSNPSGCRGGRFIGFPSILYNSRATR